MITGCVNCMKWFWIRLMQYYFSPFKVVYFSQRKKTSIIILYFHRPLLCFPCHSLSILAYQVYVEQQTYNNGRLCDFALWLNVAGGLSERRSAQTTQSIHVSRKGRIVKWWYSLGDFHILHICSLALTSHNWWKSAVAHPWPYLHPQICFKFHQTVAWDEFRILNLWDPFQIRHTF